MTDDENIICPYCFFKIKDTFEFQDQRGEIIECENCDKKFRVSQIIQITYSIEKIDQKEKN